MYIISIFIYKYNKIYIYITIDMYIFIETFI